METIASKDPRAHTANVRNEFGELIEHLRRDINKIDEPKAQALFETTAEVISGLDTAFKHYEERERLEIGVAEGEKQTRAGPAIQTKAADTADSTALYCFLLGS